MRGQLKPTPIEAAIVDLDGTMVDTLGDFEAAIGAMLCELGLPPAETGLIARMIGKGSEHLVRETLAHCAGAPERFAEAWRAYQANYGRINGSRSSVYPGVEEGLRALRERGWLLGCVTNKPRVYAEALLEMTGLREHFAVVYGGDSFERRKPDPLPLLAACRALCSTPHATLVVGDSSNDALAARAAGCPVILVSYGYNHGRPVSAVDCDGIVDRLDEL